MTLISKEEKSLKTSILIVTAIAAFLPSLLFTALVLGLPAIGNEFNANAIELGWILNSFTLSSGIFMLISGKLGDIFGRKKILSLGLFLYALSTLFISLSPNVYLIIALRVVQGIANAMVYGTVIAIVSSVFKKGERGRAVGINLTATYLGMSLGPFFGGFLTQYLGWRSVFLFLAPCFLLTLILCQLRIKTEWSDSAGEKFDIKGSLAYSFALLGIMYGFSILPSLAAWIILGAGLLFGILFFFTELKVENPIFEFKLIIYNRLFAFSILTSIFTYTATASIGFFSSLFLQYLKGIDATTAGLIMIAQPMGITLLSTQAGKLSDKFNPGIIASIGLGIISIGLGLFWFINENTHIAYMIVLLIIIGLGFGIFSSPNTNAIMSSVDKKYLGIASGTLGTARTIGQSFSMGIAMMLFSLHMGREVISPAIYPDLLLAIRTGFLVFSIISALGIIVSLNRNKRNRK